jgi:DNA-binding response OmpR family regulator
MLTRKSETQDNIVGSTQAPTIIYQAFDPSELRARVQVGNHGGASGRGFLKQTNSSIIRRARPLTGLYNR